MSNIVIPYGPCSHPQWWPTPRVLRYVFYLFEMIRQLIYLIPMTSLLRTLFIVLHPLLWMRTLEKNFFFISLIRITCVSAEQLVCIKLLDAACLVITVSPTLCWPSECWDNTKQVHVNLFMVSLELLVVCFLFSYLPTFFFPYLLLISFPGSL